MEVEEDWSTGYGESYNLKIRFEDIRHYPELVTRYHETAADLIIMDWIENSLYKRINQFLKVAKNGRTGISRDKLICEIKQQIIDENIDESSENYSLCKSIYLTVEDTEVFSIYVGVFEAWIASNGYDEFDEVLNNSVSLLFMDSFRDFKNWMTQIYAMKVCDELQLELDEIQNKSSKEIEGNSERIEVKIPIKKFAAIIYYLGQKGVFELKNYESNPLSYNASATAKLYREKFKVISQKGKTSGQEVSIEYFEQAFKESEIENFNTKKMLDALKGFPLDD